MVEHKARAGQVDLGECDVTVDSQSSLEAKQSGGEAMST